VLFRSIEEAKNSISSGVDAVTQATKDAADRVKEYVQGLSTNSQSTVNPGSGKGWA
jgi:phage-related protein